jgi:hypothetical protein
VNFCRYFAFYDKKGYTLYMKTKVLKVMILLMAIVLAAGFTLEVTYAINHQDCASCKTKCHSAPKCHNTAKACSCNYQASVTILAKNNILLGFIFSGYLKQDLNLVYHYQASDDIFHPPRV